MPRRGPGEHKHTLFNNQVYCHADHTCPAGQILHSHDQCRPAPPPQCMPGPGEHKHTLFNNQVTCHAGSHQCPTGQHATSTSTHGHVSGCHSTTDPAHQCPGNQVAGSTTAHGHVSDCETVVPAQCTPGPGEHKHTLFNNQVTCHSNHTCASGQHIYDHDQCHANHECKPTETKYDHDKCRPNVEPRPDCTPKTQTDGIQTWEIEHKHYFPTGGAYCHANHECADGLQLHGHDDCVHPVTCAEWSCGGTRDCASWFGRRQHQHFEEKGGQWQWGECHDSESDSQQGYCTDHYCFDIKRALLDDAPRHAVGIVCSDGGTSVFGLISGRAAGRWTAKQLSKQTSNLAKALRLSTDDAEAVGHFVGDVVEAGSSRGASLVCDYVTDSGADENIETVCLAYDHAATGCDGNTGIIFVDLEPDELEWPSWALSRWRDPLRLVRLL